MTVRKVTLLSIAWSRKNSSSVCACRLARRYCETPTRKCILVASIKTWPMRFCEPPLTDKHWKLFAAVCWDLRAGLEQSDEQPRSSRFHKGHSLKRTADCSRQIDRAFHGTVPCFRYPLLTSSQAKRQRDRPEQRLFPPSLCEALAAGKDIPGWAESSIQRNEDRAFYLTLLQVFCDWPVVQKKFTALRTADIRIVRTISNESRKLTFAHETKQRFPSALINTFTLFTLRKK